VHYHLRRRHEGMALPATDLHGDLATDKHRQTQTNTDYGFCLLSVRCAVRGGRIRAFQRSEE
jgi:hypothetical protein